DTGEERPYDAADKTGHRCSVTLSTARYVQVLTPFCDGVVLHFSRCERHAGAVNVHDVCDEGQDRDHQRCAYTPHDDGIRKIPATRSIGRACPDEPRET